MAGFDDATSVVPEPDGHTFQATVDPSWTVGDKPNGGYLLATLARAAASTVAPHAAHPHPLAASATFVRAPAPGPVLIEVALSRVGRSASQTRAVLVQDDRTCVEASITLGDLAGAGGPTWADEPAPEIPPEEACTRMPVLVSQDGTRVNIMEVVQVSLDPSHLGFVEGRPSGRGELSGWSRLVDGRDPDPFSLLLAVDGFPPATLELGSAGWVPTLQLTAFVRALPAPGPLRIRQRARLVEGGLVDEVCEVWDAHRRPVAQAIQLARVRFPSGGPPSGGPPSAGARGSGQPSAFPEPVPGYPPPPKRSSSAS